MAQIAGACEKVSATLALQGVAAVAGVPGCAVVWRRWRWQSIRPDAMFRGIMIID